MFMEPRPKTKTVQVPGKNTVYGKSGIFDNTELSAGNLL